MKILVLPLLFATVLTGCATTGPVARFWPPDDFIGVHVFLWIDGVKVQPGQTVVTTNETVRIKLPVANTYPHPVYAVAHRLVASSGALHQTRPPLPNKTVREHHRLLDGRSPGQAPGSHSYDSMVWVEDTASVSPGQTVTYSKHLHLELQRAIEPDALHIVEIPFTVTIKRETEQSTEE